MAPLTGLSERKAKIVATIGPASQDEAILRRLIQAGMDVTRLNFSHGTHEDHAARIVSIRKLSQELKKPIAILQDLQGPKLRVGNMPDNGIELTAGQTVMLASIEVAESLKDSLPAGVRIIPMDVPNLANSIAAGNRVLLDDGNLEFKVIRVGEKYLEALVVLGGLLKSHKGVNLPGANLNIPAFTPKDAEDLKFGLQQRVDAIAISFIRTADDVKKVREAIFQFDPSQADLPIVAKLERPEAIDNLESILDVTDGVMVARGDLGVETSPSAVPIMQKKIITAANRKGRLVITATQMLDSMINNPRPTRAEASDVANAVFDGTDAVMLSGETASGSYPVESVQMMDSIVREAERNFSEWGHDPGAMEEPAFDDAISLTRASRELAHDRNVAAIAVFTETGKTSLLMSKARPQVPILAFTPEMRTFTRLQLYWGVIPFLIPYSSTVEAMLTHIDNALISSTQIEPGEQVVMISGFPVGKKRAPNFAILHTIGERLK